MIRRIIQIDEEKCNGCGACAEACHEGAIGMVNGKATLLRDDYCDGLGDCLPTCPTGAISFMEREAAAYDEKAVQENMRKKAKSNHAAVPHTGCPGSRMQRIQHSQETTPSARVQTESQLGQWPCQIKLVPTNALYFDGAKLLIAADCSAYAYARMHEDFMRGKITIIGCPKHRLQRKADADHSKQQHSKCDGCTHGSSLLRRTGISCQKSVAGKRKIHSLADCYDFVGW